MVKPIALNQQVRFWRLSLLIGIVAAATDVVPSRVCAQIYVTDSQAGTISKYATSGMLTTGTLVTGLTRPTALAVSGSHLFVVDITGAIGPPNPAGHVGEYTTSGVAIDPSLITGLFGPEAIAVSGGNLLIASNQFGITDVGIIGEYTDSGVTESPRLFSFPDWVSGIAVSGSNLFVGQYFAPNDVLRVNGSIGAYTTSGQTVNAALLSPLAKAQCGIAVSGGSLFVTNSVTGTVGEYTTSGATVNASLISGLPGPIGIAVSGSALYVLNGDGTIGKYTAAGETVNAALISGLANVGGFAVARPEIPVQPQSVTVGTGQTASFLANASWDGPFSYQWNLNGAPIAGAVDQYLVVYGVSQSSAGSYTCTVTDADGYSSTSADATLTMSPATDTGRLMNVSVRSLCGTGAANLIAGFVIGKQDAAASAKSLLIRGVGPELTSFGVPGALPDPGLQVFNLTANPPMVVAGNTGWSSTPGNENAVIATGAQTGAFPLTPGSLSSALVASLPPNVYTANVTGVSGDSGIAIAEVYDADAAFAPTTPRLVNVSGRANVVPGAGNLIAGFVIGGSTDETVLVRGTGPGLGADPFRIPGVLKVPMLVVHQVGGGVDTVLASNSGWGGDPVLAEVAARVWAFPQSAGSADCALLLTLPPGVYTANLNSGDGGSGIALVEVYAVP
jgi:hypothetical protein